MAKTQGEILADIKCVLEDIAGQGDLTCAQLADGTRLTGILTVDPDTNEKTTIWCEFGSSTPLDPQPESGTLEPCADEQCGEPLCVKWQSVVVQLDNTGTSFTEATDFEITNADGSVVTFTVGPVAGWSDQVAAIAAAMDAAYGGTYDPRCTFLPNGCGGLLPPPSDAPAQPGIFARYINGVHCPTDQDIPVKATATRASGKVVALPLHVITTPEKRGWVCPDCCDGEAPVLLDENMQPVAAADLPACWFACSETIPEAPPATCEIVPLDGNWCDVVADPEGVDPDETVQTDIVIQIAYCPGEPPTLAYYTLDDDALIDYTPQGEIADCITGEVPSIAPPGCPEGTQFTPVEVGGSYFILDNSNWVGSPTAHITNGQAFEFTFTHEDGSTTVVQQTADPLFNNFKAEVEAAMPGCKVVYVCANHTSPTGCNAGHVANLAAYPAYDAPTFPGDIQNNLTNPDQAELWASGWLIDCGDCTSKVERIEITGANDAAYIGAFKEPTVYDHIPTTYLYAATCDGPFWKDCDGKDIAAPTGCCPTAATGGSAIPDCALVECLDPCANGSTYIFGRPPAGEPWSWGPYAADNLVDFESALAAAGYNVLQIGEKHQICPPFGAFGEDPTAPVVNAVGTSAATVEPNIDPDYVLEPPTCALQTIGKNDDRRDDLLEEIASTVTECPTGGEGEGQRCTDPIPAEALGASIKVGVNNDLSTVTFAVIAPWTLQQLADELNNSPVHGTGWTVVGDTLCTDDTTITSLDLVSVDASFPLNDAGGTGVGDADSALRTIGCLDGAMLAKLCEIADNTADPDTDITVSYICDEDLNVWVQIVSVDGVPGEPTPTTTSCDDPIPEIPELQLVQECRDDQLSNVVYQIDVAPPLEVAAAPTGEACEQQVTTSLIANGCYNGQPAAVFVKTVCPEGDCEETAGGNLFANGDLEGTIGISVVPPSWAQIPSTDPVSQASGPPRDTSDITGVTGHSVGAGIIGTPHSGSTFVSSLYSPGGSLAGYSEGLQQNVTGLTVGATYQVCFWQSVVQQTNATAQTGSWEVFLDNTSVATTAPTTTGQTGPTDINLNWEQRCVTFTATATSHDIKIAARTTEAQPVRMGIDTLTLVEEGAGGSCCVGIECVAVIPAGQTTPITPAEGVAWSLAPCPVAPTIDTELELEAICYVFDGVKSVGWQVIETVFVDGVETSQNTYLLDLTGQPAEGVIEACDPDFSVLQAEVCDPELGTLIALTIDGTTAYFDPTNGQPVTPANVALVEAGACAVAPPPSSHLIEGCILVDGEPVEAYTIINNDGKPLFDPRPLSELGFTDCCPD